MIQALSSFDADARARALKSLAETACFPEETAAVNMHLHTFFSYNGEGWSPSRLAYEMKRLGVHAAAICDFDVVSGLDEFLAAGDILRLRTAVAFEVRTFFSEYAEHEINSPGEPGVFYFMGMGFASMPTGRAADGFSRLLSRSHERNRALVARVNAALSDFQLDYDRDVLPLTPAGNATERHICVALYQKALDVLKTPEKAAASWAASLKHPIEKIAQDLPNQNAFTDFLRSKLMKKGGPGYVQPDKNTFPPLEEVIRLILDCRAIPMTAWLDGSLSGEADPDKQLDCLIAKGIAALNIIPDRNWNIADPAKKAVKVHELNRMLDAAARRKLPVNVGTEANKPGQRLLDDFAADALAPHRKAFLDGADLFVGHTRLLRFANVSYSDPCDGRFRNLDDKQRFFRAVGALPAPAPDICGALVDSGPEKAWNRLADSAAKGMW